MEKQFKNKLAKILLYLSLLPYPLILINGIFAYFRGCSFFFSTYYGFEGMRIAVVMSVMMLCTIVPVLPVCILYDIFYILRKTLWKEIPQKVYIRRIVAVSIILFSVFAAYFIYPELSYRFSKMTMKNKALKMIDACEEKIVYDESEIYAAGILDIKDYPCGTVFLDCDEMKIGILTGYGLEQYYEYKMVKSDTDAFYTMKNEYSEQAVISFKSGTLYAFSKSSEYSHMTYALAFCDESGSIYTKTNLSKDTAGILTFLGNYYYSNYYEELKK